MVLSHLFFVTFVLINIYNIMKYFPPKFKDESYNCPYCDVYAKQYWNKLSIGGGYMTEYLKEYQVSCCSHCNKYAMWYNEKMVIPVTGNAPIANEDMPEDVLEDYNEAKAIVNQSPRGAAALLRLAVQKLCKHLGEKGKNINDDIKSLVSKGLPEKIQKSLDFVRVVGNNAVHPGKLDLKDDVDTANYLFVLVNYICDSMITQPKKVDKLYDLIPDNTKKAIDIRDQ